MAIILPPTPRRKSGTRWVQLSRDRLSAFRALFLGFALILVIGLMLIHGHRLAADPDALVRLVVSAILLTLYWVYGFKRGGFRLGLLPLEAGLVVMVGTSMNDPMALIGLTYSAIQYRALYDQRRAATLTVAAYVVVYFGMRLSGIEAGAPVPAVVAIELLAFALCGFLMHTLAEVLSRDLERSEALRGSELRYRRMFDHNPMPMWIVDIETLTIRDANAAAIAQYGYSHAEFVGMPLRLLRPQGNRAEFDEFVPTLQSEQLIHQRVTHQRRDGSTLEVEITSQVMELDGQGVRVAVAVDISDRERALQALRDSEQRFRAVVENLREAILIADLEDRILLANSRAREVLGYEPDEIIGKVATELLLPPEERRAFAERLTRRKNGIAELYEVELLRKDGTRMVAEVSASPYRDASGNVIGTLGAISDITERKRMEERLQQASRMEVVGQLAGGVAHDFNNLLTVINCHTELLMDDVRGNAPVRDSVGEIARAANRGATLTRQLLAFGRRQLLQPRRIVLADVVANSVPKLRRSLRDNVRLITTSDGARDEVHADPFQVEQVLGILVGNANDAMTGEGRITIDTRCVGRVDVPDQDSVEPLAERFVMLSVADTGCGMTDAVRAHLFEPFFTTKALGEGTGLGLASMYGIVRQSGGFVDVETAPRAGSTFRIFFPCAVPPPSATNAPHGGGLPDHVIAGASSPR